MNTYIIEAYISKVGYAGMARIQVFNINAKSEEHAKNIIRKYARNRKCSAVIKKVTKKNLTRVTK